MSQHILILLSAITCTFFLHNTLFLVTQLHGGQIFIEITKCYVQNTAGRQSVCHRTSTTSLTVEFSCSSIWQFITKNLSSKRLLCEKCLSDCHTFTVRRFILLSFKHQTNKTNLYISPTQPMTVETQNFRTAKTSYFLLRSQFCYRNLYCKI